MAGSCKVLLCQSVGHFLFVPLHTGFLSQLGHGGHGRRGVHGVHGENNTENEQGSMPIVLVIKILTSENSISGYTN